MILISEKHRVILQKSLSNIPMKASLFTSIWLPLAFICLFASCGNQTDAQISAIPDNLHPRLMPASLFADAPEALIEELGLKNGIPSSVCTFLAEKNGKQALFDAGNGADNSQLLPLLNSRGIAPKDIDYIFITHLHGDHTGGLMKGQEATFPHAILYIPSTEYHAWMAMPEERNAQIRAIANAYGERMKVFDNHTELPLGITPIPAYGHTPGHTLYRIGNHLIAGDLMHGVALQLEHPNYCARYDMDIPKAIEARKQILQLAKDEGLTLYGMHFPEPYSLVIK